MRTSRRVCALEIDAQHIQKYYILTHIRLYYIYIMPIMCTRIISAIKCADPCHAEEPKHSSRYSRPAIVREMLQRRRTSNDGVAHHQHHLDHPPAQIDNTEVISGDGTWPVEEVGSQNCASTSNFTVATPAIQSARWRQKHVHNNGKRRALQLDCMDYSR